MRDRIRLPGDGDLAALLPTLKGKRLCRRRGCTMVRFDDSSFCEDHRDSDCVICGTPVRFDKLNSDLECAECRPACIGKDEFCPCQDGLLCHYKDDPTGATKAWPLVG